MKLSTTGSQRPGRRRRSAGLDKPGAAITREELFQRIFEAARLAIQRTILPDEGHNHSKLRANSVREMARTMSALIKSGNAGVKRDAPADKDSTE
jgi:hypothetical protein